ncbi:unnamed protein product [Spirodela intermedia]|uniref:Transcription factor HY5 n=1 Tax=Spirodela intermedia TaxID=51605 RepID=A0A7I8JNS6_SPIIN|nr:unnamed protein product [Spirodela intermedia]CAA6671750.1 unnamed protein product [Spirodela intermedia]
MQEQGTSSFQSSSDRSSSSAAHQTEVNGGLESDDEIRRVPDFGGETAAGPSTSGPRQDRTRASSAEAGQQRKRGRNPADKSRSASRGTLLRNRVSAQQARERKKAYLTDLETKVNELEKRNSELEERLSTLQNENQMLRHILKNTTGGGRRGSGGGSAEGEA